MEQVPSYDVMILLGKSFLIRNAVTLPEECSRLLGTGAHSYANSSNIEIWYEIY